MDAPLQPQLPKTCGSPAAAGKSCLDMRVAVLLVTLAGAAVLLLLYRLLQLRHRLKLARARHALEYYSFYHSATYTLKHTAPSQDPPAKNGTIPEATPRVLNETTVTLPLPHPPAFSPPTLPLPPPPVIPPSSMSTAGSVLALPLHLPVIHTTPPSPHLSWGACSDTDVYTRIGAFGPPRLSRLSRLSSNSKVILFEHSSL